MPAAYQGFFGGGILAACVCGLLSAPEPTSFVVPIVVGALLAYINHRLVNPA